MTYKALVYPYVAGGGPGAKETVALTVTATGSASSNPVVLQANAAAYTAASADDKTRHERATDIVRFFSQYGTPVEVSSATNVLTMKFEVADLFEDSARGKPGYFNGPAARPTAYELAQAYVAANSFTVSAMTVTIDGVAQNA